MSKLLSLASDNAYVMHMCHLDRIWLWLHMEIGVSGMGMHML